MLILKYLQRPLMHIAYILVPRMNSILYGEVVASFCAQLRRRVHVNLNLYCKLQNANTLENFMPSSIGPCVRLVIHSEFQKHIMKLSIFECNYTSRLTDILNQMHLILFSKLQVGSIESFSRCQPKSCGKTLDYGTYDFIPSSLLS